MNSNEIENYTADGFSGFIPVSQLRENLAGIPVSGGVYIVIRESDDAPVFLVKGTGTFVDGKDPNVPVSALKTFYVPDSKVMYIGKSTRLRKRISQLLRFGAGTCKIHWGGRSLWQLADAENLLIAWKLTPSASPRDEEKRILAEFESRHGHLPFANLII